MSKNFPTSLSILLSLPVFICSAHSADNNRDWELTRYMIESIIASSSPKGDESLKDYGLNLPTPYILQNLTQETEVDRSKDDFCELVSATAMGAMPSLPSFGALIQPKNTALAPSSIPNFVHPNQNLHSENLTPEKAKTDLEKINSATLASRSRILNKDAVLESKRKQHLDYLNLTEEEAKETMSISLGLYKHFVDNVPFSKNPQNKFEKSTILKICIEDTMSDQIQMTRKYYLEKYNLNESNIIVHKQKIKTKLIDYIENNIDTLKAAFPDDSCSIDFLLQELNLKNKFKHPSCSILSQENPGYATPAQEEKGERGQAIRKDLKSTDTPYSRAHAILPIEPHWPPLGPTLRNFGYNGFNSPQPYTQQFPNARGNFSLPQPQNWRQETNIDKSENDFCKIVPATVIEAIPSLPSFGAFMQLEKTALSPSFKSNFVYPQQNPHPKNLLDGKKTTDPIKLKSTKIATLSHTLNKDAVLESKRKQHLDYLSLTEDEAKETIGISLGLYKHLVNEVSFSKDPRNKFEKSTILKICLEETITQQLNYEDYLEKYNLNVSNISIHKQKIKTSLTAYIDNNIDTLKFLFPDDSLSIDLLNQKLNPNRPMHPFPMRHNPTTPIYITPAQNETGERGQALRKNSNSIDTPYSRANTMRPIEANRNPLGAAPLSFGYNRFNSPHPYAQQFPNARGNFPLNPPQNPGKIFPNHVHLQPDSLSARAIYSNHQNGNSFK